MNANKKKSKENFPGFNFAPSQQPAGFVRVRLQSPCPEPYLQRSKDLSQVVMLQGTFVLHV
jgi:hypothetical protein